MSAGTARTAEEWARVIAEAYAAGTRPPLTDHLVARVQGALASALGGDAAGSTWSDRVNAALDAFETSLDAAAGPRLVSADETTGTVQMEHRSEAGQPLRAFGGQ